MSENTRIGTNAEDYFLDRQKKLDFADRRPVLRRPSDLVGPGIAPQAVRVTDWSDLLATFNGFFSSAPNAKDAPNSAHSFVGYVSSDAELGGVQSLTSLNSGAIFQRVFTRNTSDASILYWGPWKTTFAG